MIEPRNVSRDNALTGRTISLIVFIHARTLVCLLTSLIWFVSLVLQMMTMHGLITTPRQWKYEDERGNHKGRENNNIAEQHYEQYCRGKWV